MTLSTVNAILNTASALCLVAGYVFIKQRRFEAHRFAMLAAFTISALFLVSYVIHHARVGSVPFQGTGFMRVVYFAILIPHVILAASVVPLAIVTIKRGLAGNFARHRPLARVTLPVWLFVSVSGVIVYLMLYRL
jgi:putative membrane protein